jgi:hypothetical protein
VCRPSSVGQATVGIDIERGESAGPTDSATMSVELSGVTIMPFGDAMASATGEPSGSPARST